MLSSKEFYIEGEDSQALTRPMSIAVQAYKKKGKIPTKPSIDNKISEHP